MSHSDISAGTDYDECRSALVSQVRLLIAELATKVQGSSCDVDESKLLLESILPYPTDGRTDLLKRI
jgi:hypothetical protein